MPHHIVAHISQCKCGHTIDDLGTHLLWCSCESECTTAHNTLQNLVVIIVSESGSHVQKEVSHLFLHHTQRQMDIFITRYGFKTLMEVIIVDPIRKNMVQQTSMMTTHVVKMAV